MRTLMSCPSSVAFIYPTNKSENSCEKTNRDPLLHDMRWAIVELMTFLVVAAFKPNKTLLRPSPKLGSDVVWSQLLGLILIKQMLDSFYDCTPNTQLFFAVFILCWFASVQSAIENLWSISNLDVCIEIENFWDWFIVCIDEGTAHGSFEDNHEWIHTVERSIQTKPQSFILVVVTSILMYVCRRSWHEWKKKPTLQLFWKLDAQWQAQCSSNLYFSKVLHVSVCPQNGSDSNAQPLFMW